MIYFLIAVLALIALFYHLTAVLNTQQDTFRVQMQQDFLKKSFEESLVVKQAIFDDIKAHPELLSDDVVGEYNTIADLTKLFDIILQSTTKQYSHHNHHQQQQHQQHEQQLLSIISKHIEYYKYQHIAKYLIAQRYYNYIKQYFGQLYFNELKQNDFFFTTIITTMLLFIFGDFFFYLIGHLHHLVYVYPYYIQRLYDVVNCGGVEVLAEQDLEDNTKNNNHNNNNNNNHIGNNDDNNNNNNHIHPHKLAKLTTPLQYVAYIVTALFLLTSIVALTCHSPIQTYLLIATYIIIGFLSPLLFNFLRKITHWKRVIRGPWDYDDQNEVGKDNI